MNGKRATGPRRSHRQNPFRAHCPTQHRENGRLARLTSRHKKRKGKHHANNKSHPQATEATVDSWSDPHPPKAEAVKSFRELEHTLKKELVHLRHEHDKHEPEYFAAVAHLSDHDLAGFSVDDFDQVRVGTSAYGYHLFGRVRIPALSEDGPCYIFFRLFDTGKDAEAQFHSFHTEQAKDEVNGGFKYRAVFTKDDKLEWFNE